MFILITGGSEGKASACNMGDQGSIPGLGRSPGEGIDNPLQYSWLENTMDRGAWEATVLGFAKSRTLLSNFTSLHFILITSIWMMSKTILDQRANSKLWKHVFRSGHIYFRKWVEEEEESTLIPKVWSVLILGLITPALWSQHLLCQRAIYFRSQHYMRRLRIYRAVSMRVSTFSYL